MADTDLPAGAARGAEKLLLPSGGLDNIILMEWMEGARGFLQNGAVVLALSGGAVDAKLRGAPGLSMSGGLSKRYRAHVVGKQIQNAAQAIAVGARYMTGAFNQFEAHWMPELEAVGYKQGSQPSSGMTWKAR